MKIINLNYEEKEIFETKERTSNQNLLFSTGHGKIIQKCS